jgi:hypothetical protein
MPAGHVFKLLTEFPAPDKMCGLVVSVRAGIRRKPAQEQSPRVGAF